MKNKSNLPEEEKKRIHENIGIMTIAEAKISGFFKPSYVRDNMEKFTNGTGLGVADVKEALAYVYTKAMEDVFSGERSKIGFKKES